MEVGGGILLITTMTLVMLGLVISYVCRWGNNMMGDSNIVSFRACKNRNVKSLFHCDRCCQGKVNPFLYDGHPCPPSGRYDTFDPPTHHRRSSSQCAMITREQDDLIPDDDMPLELISLLENKSNWEVRRRTGLLRQVTRTDRWGDILLKTGFVHLYSTVQ